MMMKRMEHIFGEVTTYQAGFAGNHLMLTWLESPSVVDVFPIGKWTFPLLCLFSLEQEILHYTTLAMHGFVGL